MDKKDYIEDYSDCCCSNGSLDNSDKSCAAINACSRDGIYSILIVLLAIAILILIYFIANFLL